MCGIAGIVHLSSSKKDTAIRMRIEKMRDRLTHRGPDDAGTWLSDNKQTALVHRRLSIIDTSTGGHQPMTSESGRYVMVFNGEIYNFQTLRRELSQFRSSPWNSQSDTEVLLTAFERWGLPKTLHKVDGMFAIGLWDKKNETLVLARDPIGEKPLYYRIAGEILTFASELKAFDRHNSSIDESALNEFLKYGYTSSPNTVLQGIKRLPPSSYLLFDRCQSPTIHNYWRITDVADNGLRSPLESNQDHILSTIESAVKESISSRMIADVPLGAFLSGGYDSSLVVALMREFSNAPVKTFSIGFESKDYNEAPHAKEVARHLGTEHKELYLTANDAQAIVPELPRIFCEPFADPSQIPTIAVSRLARESVKTVLSGDGGDELFFGYNRHIWAKRIQSLQGRPSRHVFRAAAKMINCLPPTLIGGTYDWFSRFLPQRFRTPQVADKIQKLARCMSQEDAITLYEAVTSSESNSTFPSESLPTSFQSFEKEHGITPAVVLLDMLRYLPNDILAKVDRASMSAGLEPRVPLLSRKLIEISWRVPLEMKVRNGSGKWILKELVHKYIPKELMNRPKAGFSVPIGDWLKGELFEWSASLLSPNALRAQNDFAPEPILKKWDAHVKGTEDHAKALWNVITFLEWKRHTQNA